MLADLAPELLLDVLAFLEYADLRHVALTNHALHTLASSIMYRRIVVTGKLASFAPVRNLFMLLATRTYPARYVHELHLDFFAAPGCIVQLSPEMPSLVSAACAGMTNLNALFLGECFDALLVPALQHAYFPNLRRLSLHSYRHMECFVSRHAAELTHFQCVWPLPLSTPHFAHMTHFEGTMHNVAIACKQPSQLREFTSGNFTANRNGVSPFPRMFIPTEVGFECLAYNAPDLQRMRLYHYGSVASFAESCRMVTKPLVSIRELELQFASPGLDPGQLMACMPIFLALFPRIRSLRLHPLFAVGQCGPCPVQLCRSLRGVAHELELVVWADRAMRRKACGNWHPVAEGPPPALWTPIVPTP